MKNISFVFVGGITVKKLTELTEGEDIYTKITAINTLASTIGMLLDLGLFIPVLRIRFGR